MEKTKFFILILLIGFVIGIGIFFGLQFYKPKVKTHSNITELYSLFTPYMEDTVDLRLGIIECKPEKYYYDDSSACFVCDEMDACFSYVFISRAGGEKMNPIGASYLKNYKKFTVEVADFYNDGLASLFECVIDGETLECKDSVVFIEKEATVGMLLKDRDKLEDVSRTICDYYEEESVECENLICSCGNRIVELSGEQVSVYTVM